MRMLSGEEAPDSGTRTAGHQVVMEYFAQDEATRLDPKLTVYETLQYGSPNNMVPAIRNILGGFLFSGDDVYKKAGVLSGGERTRLAVARMLLRPSNTLLLDEPTNHLDLDSKDVLLDALEDYGGTLIIVSHDRYFVEKLATKIIEIGHGAATIYPGTYAEFLWSKEHGASRPDASTGQRENTKSQSPNPKTQIPKSKAQAAKPKAQSADPKSQGPSPDTQPDNPSSGDTGGRATSGGQAPRVAAAGPQAGDRDARKHAEAERKKAQRAVEVLKRRIADLEARIAEREVEVKQVETTMSAPGFYENHEASKPIIDRHQALMWEVGDLIAQWEALQAHAAEQSPGS
jgi:ATP-binding cassette subfamily F protein 3